MVKTVTLVDITVFAIQSSNPLVILIGRNTAIMISAFTMLT